MTVIFMSFWTTMPMKGQHITILSIGPFANPELNRRHDRPPYAFEIKSDFGTHYGIYCRELCK
jgi:hypothetical protein